MTGVDVPAPVALEDAGIGLTLTTPISWVLPHNGPATSDWCGTLRWVGHRENEDWIHGWRRRQDCAQRHCGVCKSTPVEICGHCGARSDAEDIPLCTNHLHWAAGTHNWLPAWDIRGWERRGASRIQERWDAWLKGPLQGRTPFHLVVSPPQHRAQAALDTAEGYRALRDEMRAQTRSLGVEAACGIFHHKRLGIGTEARGCRDGPHWHLIAVGTGPMNGQGFDGDFIARWSLLTGWVAKWLGPRESIYLTAAYLLSHAALAVPTGGALSCLSGEVLPEPVETVTWWGWKRGWPSPVRSGLEKCPVCEVDLDPEDIFDLRFNRSVPSNPPDRGKGLVILALDVELVPSASKLWGEYRAQTEHFYQDRDYSGPDAVTKRPVPPGRTEL